MATVDPIWTVLFTLKFITAAANRLCCWVLLTVNIWFVTQSLLLTVIAIAVDPYQPFINLTVLGTWYASITIR